MRSGRPRPFAALLLVLAIPLATPVAAGAQAGSNAQIGDPFTAASLDNALTGMRVFKTRMAAAGALSAQYLANQKKISALEDANRRQLDEYEQNVSKINSCVQAFTDAQKPMRDEQMRKKMLSLMGDQAAYQKFIGETTRLGQAAATAQAKGDSVGSKKAMNDLMKLLGMDPAVDSLAGVAKCGAPPGRPAARDQIDQLTRQDNDLSPKIRLAENSAEIDAAKAAGVAPVTFAQMRERLGLFVTNGQAFQGKEGDVLHAHQREIEDLFKTQ